MQSLRVLSMVGGENQGPGVSFCSCDGKHRCNGHVISVLPPLASELPHLGAPLSCCRLQHTLQLVLHAAASLTVDGIFGRLILAAAQHCEN